MQDDQYERWAEAVERVGYTHDKLRDTAAQLDAGDEITVGKLQAAYMLGRLDGSPAPEEELTEAERAAALAWLNEHTQQNVTPEPVTPEPVTPEPVTPEPVVEEPAVPEAVLVEEPVTTAPEPIVEPTPAVPETAEEPF